MNWMSITGLIFIVIGTVLSFFGTLKSGDESETKLTTKIQEKNNTIDKINVSNIKLIEQNASLLSSSDKVSKTNNELIGLNTDMLTRISNYQKDIEERNKKIEQLQEDIANVKNYSYYAPLDQYGKHFSGKAPQGMVAIQESSDLSNRMTKVLTDGIDRIFVKKYPNILEYLDKIIQDYPKFPFAYYAKFMVLKDAENNEWKLYAKKSLLMFEITTTIIGHHPSHDVALKFIQQSLATNK